LLRIASEVENGKRQVFDPNANKWGGKSDWKSNGNSWSDRSNGWSDNNTWSSNASRQTATEESTSKSWRGSKGDDQQQRRRAPEPVQKEEEPQEALESWEDADS